MRFGERIKQLRLERNLGLREFCENVGVDPSNWSKIERGFKNFNTEDSLLFHSITVNLQIPKDSDLWAELFLLSYVDNIDREKLFDENLLLKSLPFCLSVDGKKPTIEQYERLLELLENEIETMKKESEKNNGTI